MLARPVIPAVAAPVVATRRVRLGHQFEDCFVGGQVKRPRRRSEDWPQGACPVNRLDWHTAILEAACNQALYGWDPYHPTKGSPAAQLYYWVAKHFPPRQRAVLGLFLAFDFSCDVHSGADLFFLLGAPSQRLAAPASWLYQRRRLVTIDLTLRPTKLWRADLLVTPRSVECEHLAALGTAIADFFQERIGLAGLRQRNLYLLENTVRRPLTKLRLVGPTNQA